MSEDEEWDATVFADAREDVCEWCGIKCIVRPIDVSEIEYFGRGPTQIVLVCGGCMASVARDV